MYVQDQRDITAGKMLGLQMANLDLAPTISYGPREILPGMIPGHRARNKF